MINVLIYYSLYDHIEDWTISLKVLKSIPCQYIVSLPHKDLKISCMMQQQIFKIAMCLLLTLTLCHGGNSMKNIDIFRGAHDRFNVNQFSNTHLAICMHSMYILV